jgi:hypothetical protein
LGPNVLIYLPRALGPLFCCPHASDCLSVVQHVIDLVTDRSYLGVVIEDIKLLASWNQAGAEADWDTTLESLRRNLGARSIHLVEEDGLLKIL